MRSVAILYHHESEGWWAESEALLGWTAAGRSLDEVRRQVMSAVAAFIGEGAVLEEEGLPADRDRPCAAG
jgi:predicted RNase H-like HicB family nuclease